MCITVLSDVYFNCHILFLYLVKFDIFVTIFLSNGQLDVNDCLDNKRRLPELFYATVIVSTDMHIQCESKNFYTLRFLEIFRNG